MSAIRCSATRRVGLALLAAASTLCAHSAQAEREGLLLGPGAERYRLTLHSFGGEGQPLVQSAAEVELTVDDQARRTIDLHRVGRFERSEDAFKTLLIDSDDPCTDDLPEHVLLRFTLDALEPLEGLFPADIPDTAFGLMLEATAILSMPSRRFGFDKLDKPGDSVEFEGFEHRWTRPRGSSESRRVTAGGRTVYERLDNGVAHVRVTLEPYDWVIKWGYEQFSVNVGQERFDIRFLIDTATGRLLEARTLENRFRFASAAQYDHPVPFPEVAPEVPEGAQWFDSSRELTIEPMENEG